MKTLEDQSKLFMQVIRFFSLLFEIRKNLDLIIILFTPIIFLKSRFYCSASCAHTTSTPNQKFIYNQDFSAMLDRISGICCFYAPNWLERLPEATQVRSLVPTKSFINNQDFYAMPDRIPEL